MGVITFKENAYGYFSLTQPVGGTNPESNTLEMTMRPVYGGIKTTVIVDAANQVISVPGLLATDVVMTMDRVQGAMGRYILAAVAAADQINVTMSADPGATDHTISWIAFRAF